MLSSNSIKPTQTGILDYTLETSPLKEIADMLPQQEYIVYPANIVLINEHAKSEHIFFILSGAVSLSYTNNDNKKQLFDIAGPNDIIGLSGCLLNKESIYKAKTLGTTTCFTIRKEVFDHMVNNNTGFIAKMTSIVSAEAEKKERKIFNLQHLDVYERLSVAVIRFKKIFGVDRAGYIRYKFSDQILNQLLNTNTYDLYMAFEKMEENNSVSYRKGMIEILDVESLKREVFKRGKNLF